MTKTKAPERIWAYDDGAHVLAFDAPTTIGGAVEYVRADIAHAREKQEPVGSDRAMYVCASCVAQGEEYSVHPRDRMRVVDGAWFCKECASEPLGAEAAEALPLPPELFPAPPTESEEVARLRAALRDIASPDVSALTSVPDSAIRGMLYAAVSVAEDALTANEGERP